MVSKFPDVYQSDLSNNAMALTNVKVAQTLIFMNMQIHLL